jgi:peptidoglycan/xylan/chitin deacetylase (PgdA/CDA1 family)
VKSKNARVLITADLDEPDHDPHLDLMLGLLERERVSLTLFVTNTWKEDFPGVLDKLEAARTRGMRVEIASHSLKHERMSNLSTAEIVSAIAQSLNDFRSQGLQVTGFRMPLLCTELRYREILQEADRANIGLSYDSSVMLEGKFRFSHLYNMLPVPWKNPQMIGKTWELPISCMDDWHMFVKYGHSDDFARRFWMRRLDRNLGFHGYFLFLLHPFIFWKHMDVLTSLIDCAEERCGFEGFVTCSELVRELDREGAV